MHNRLNCAKLPYDAHNDQKNAHASAECEQYCLGKGWEFVRPQPNKFLKWPERYATEAPPSGSGGTKVSEADTIKSLQEELQRYRDQSDQQGGNTGSGNSNNNNGAETAIINSLMAGAGATDLEL